MDLDKTVVVAIDLQNENFEAGAWPVYDYDTVLARASRILEAARAAQTPIVYTRHWLAPDGSDSMRHEEMGPDGAPLHSVAGTPGAAICDRVAPKPGDIIMDKTRYSAFYASKLDVVLQRYDAAHLIILGVWTEACLETTVWDALWRDYRITLVKDACGTATATMHKCAVLDMANWLFGGRIIRTDELVKALRGQEYSCWQFKKPSAFKYDLDTIDRLYDEI